MAAAKNCLLGGGGLFGGLCLIPFIERGVTVHFLSLHPDPLSFRRPHTVLLIIRCGVVVSLDQTHVHGYYVWVRVRVRVCQL